MDNQQAADGIRTLLSKLGDDELYSLTNTVTQGLLKDKVANRQGKFLFIKNHSIVN